MQNQKGTMRNPYGNLRLALAFLHDAQHDLDTIFATPIAERGEDWEERLRAAMRYRARAYTQFREAHAGTKRAALGNAA
jgi:hypothetical protein